MRSVRTLVCALLTLSRFLDDLVAETNAYIAEKSS